LKVLLEDCWQKDPALRPSFDQINVRLNDILGQIAIRDADALKFWKDKFTQGITLQKSVEFMAFAVALYRHLGLGRPPVDRTPETEDVAVLQLRALKAVIATLDQGSDDSYSVDIQYFGKVVDWFPPFAALDGGETIIHRIYDTCCLKYFHGDLEAKAAAKDLAIVNEEGAYMVRFSNLPPGAYAITRIAKFNKVKNAKIFCHSPGHYSLIEKAGGTTYPTIDALVTAMKDTLGLATPCPGSRFEKIGNDEVPEYEPVTARSDEEGEETQVKPREKDKKKKKKKREKEG